MKETEDTLLVDGNRLEVSWIGPSPQSAPTLVFLHEGLGCVEMWKDFPAKLAASTGCGALVYSRLGYGKSEPCTLPRSTRFMHHEGLKILPQLIEKAGINRHILIGHSDGGSISIIYAGGTTANLLNGVVTMAPHVFCEVVSVHSIEEAKGHYQNGDLRQKLEKYHGNNIDNAFWGWNGAWLDLKFINWNIEEYLPSIKVPLLVIQGENDPYGTKAQVNAIAKQSGNGAEVMMLPNCGHSPQKDQETATLEAITKFILNTYDGEGFR